MISVAALRSEVRHAAQWARKETVGYSNGVQWTLTPKYSGWELKWWQGLCGSHFRDYDHINYTYIYILWAHQPERGFEPCSTEISFEYIVNVNNHSRFDTCPSSHQGVNLGQTAQEDTPPPVPHKVEVECGWYRILQSNNRKTRPNFFHEYFPADQW